MDRLHRRAFLAGSGTAVAAGAGLTAVHDESRRAPAVIGNTRTVTLSMPWPQSVAGPADAAHRLARRIEMASDGRFRVQVQASSTGGDLDYGPESRQSNTNPAASYVSGLPGHAALSAIGVDAWLRTGGGQELWDDVAAQSGTKPLLAGHSGPLTGLWTRERLTDPSQVSGRVFAADGLAGRVVTGLGGRLGTSESDADLFGVEDEHGLLSDAALDRAKRFGHLSLSGLTRQGFALSLHVRRGLWDGLTPSEQGVMGSAAAEEFAAQLSEAHTYGRAAIDALEKAHGLRVTRAAMALDTAIDSVAEAVVAQMAGTDRVSRRMNASYMAFRAHTIPAGAPMS